MDLGLRIVLRNGFFKGFSYNKNNILLLKRIISHNHGRRVRLSSPLLSSPHVS